MAADKGSDSDRNGPTSYPPPYERHDTSDGRQSRATENADYFNQKAEEHPTEREGGANGTSVGDRTQAPPVVQRKNSVIFGRAGEEVDALPELKNERSGNEAKIYF